MFEESRGWDVVQPWERAEHFLGTDMTDPDGFPIVTDFDEHYRVVLAPGQTMDEYVDELEFLEELVGDPEELQP